MKKSILFLFLFLCGLSVRAQIPATLSGNWINLSTNDWEYGFFEHFAIYDTAFWDYESIEEKGKKTRIALRNGDRTVCLELSLGKDGTLTIKKEKEKAADFQKMGKTYPRYSEYDAKMFPESDFNPDSATLIGYYHDFDKIPESHKKAFGANFITLAIHDFMTGESNDYKASLDSLGRFELTVPLLNTQEIYADWRRLNKVIVLQPGDRQFLFAEMPDLLRQGEESWESYQARDKEILFMGTNTRLNNELMQYKSLPLHIDFYEEREKGLKGMEYLRYCEEVYEKKKAHHDNYIAGYPAVSDRFRFYTKESERYRFAGDLMQHRFNLNRREGERFPEGYMEFVDEHFSISDPQVYTLTRDFFFFLRDYLGYAEEETGSTSVSVDLKEVVQELKRNGLVDPETQRQLEAYTRFSEAVEKEPDEEKRQEMAAAPEIVKLSEEISSNSLLLGTMNSLVAGKYFEMEVNAADSLLAGLSALKELWLGHLYYEYFDNNRLPLTSREMDDFNNRIHNPYYRERLLGVNDYYAGVQKQDIGDESSLKDTRHLEEVYDMEKLFAELIEPYKGKVIYIDFWGTWCGPCRENMALMPDIKKELAGKEIVFMYFANNSPEQTWRSMIKEMGLTGENIVHYRLASGQQAMLERHFSVNSFPTYMIVDRQGKIIDKNAPAPKERENLLKALNKALTN